jgi:hypothetical protein
MTHQKEMTMFTTPSSRRPTIGRHLVHAGIIVGAACAMALPSWAQESQPAQQASVPTRAEVVADLKRWRYAGMDRFQPLAVSYGLETEAYQRAFREYMRLSDVEQRRSEASKQQTD